MFLQNKLRNQVRHEKESGINSKSNINIFEAIYILCTSFFSYQGGDEVNAVGVVRVVHLHAAADALVSAGLYGGLEGVSVVEMLHGLTAQVDTQLL